MGKRQRSTEEVPSNSETNDLDREHPVKKPRKETNASARRTLFVRSLPAVATRDALTDFFSQKYALKHATVVLDTETKQSKGYGFVTFADAEDASRAQEEFNGQIFLGRKMKIEIAEPRSRENIKRDGVDSSKKSEVSQQASAMKKARMEKAAENKPNHKLIIRNLPWSIKTPDLLADLFKKYGKVKFSTLPKIRDDTQAGFGFVTMRGHKNAEKAMASLNGTIIDGRTIAVDWAVEKSLWESQNKDVSKETEASHHGSSIQLNSALTKTKKQSLEIPSSENETPSNQEEDDLKNFFEKFGDNLESEEEEEDDDDERGNDEKPRKNKEKQSDPIMDEDDALLWEDDGKDDSDNVSDEEDEKLLHPKKTFITDNSTTLFIRNLPFTLLDAGLKEFFENFGPVRYARVVIDRATDRPKGTGFVCFYNVEDADSCYRNAPRAQPSGANATKIKHSILQNESADTDGLYTLDGRVLQVSKAVERDLANKLTEAGANFRTDRDKDKRKLFLLGEGTIASNSPLYNLLSPSEIKMREDSAMQRKKLIQNNPALHLSLTRLSVRNLPRHITSKELKALAREAVVGFAKDVKSGLRAQLSKEEESRGGEEDRLAENHRKAKKKGIVRQSKVVFEGREGNKISEDSGAGRSRGYGFIEYYSHRWALMGLRWLNGHVVENSTGKTQRLIVEFAIENAQVVQRRKESEEKARLRSLEVVKARERGELPEKEKKVLKNSQIMAKTRKGMKGKKPRPKSSEVAKVKGKGEPPEKEQKVPKKSRTVIESRKSMKGKKGKPDPSTRPDDELAKKSQIIQRKRQMRKLRR
ncbi:hypothetical protein K3495_g4549 [Podosphaera aphanis]|nr:hypothetical protein K3495_g4549 [Podosphaera aphanis]